MKFNKCLKKSLENISTFIFLIMFLVTSAQIILRNVFNIPLLWTEELARYLYVWLTFLGAGVLASNKDHIKIDIVIQKLPERISKIVLFIIDIAIIIFSFFVLRGGIIMMKLTIDAPSTTMPNLISLAHVYFIIPIGMGFVIYYTIMNLFDLRKK